MGRWGFFVPIAVMGTTITMAMKTSADDVAATVSTGTVGCSTCQGGGKRRGGDISLSTVMKS
jgi:hypothetical protein